MGILSGPDLRSNLTQWGPQALARMDQQSTGPRMLGWNVKPEDLHQIPEHWFKYPEPDPLQNYMLGLLYVLFTFVSLFGNGLVIWIFSTAKSLRTPSNFFVVNLAICDFGMMLKTPIMIYNSFNLGFESGAYWCRIFALVGSFTGIGQACTNAAIAYDRYNAIARPFDGKMSAGKAFMVLLIIWLYVTPWAILPYIEKWNRFVPEGYLTTCTFDYLSPTKETQFFVLTMFTVCYVIPMSLVVFFYSRIVGHVFSHEKALREQAKKMNVESLRSGQDPNAQSAEVRIAKAAITICFLFIASWTPYAVVALIGAFGDQNLLTPGITMLPACTCKLVACLDPYVYAISHPRYRLELSKRMPCFGINESPPAETASTTTETTNSANTPSS
ncbi:unnamed protein product [Bemisia tabaci]|uniref:G-protein coupled receptors family 1 profile domain-containing protein n=1 Tax=Bemisia tabaci TaxID=7038 RepID=A0A9P0A042_BEMTA|nr:PREDICTED: opsin, ultraviolet-sensitive [Bemisia tabaci]CAH0381522.1 unnamed protein product [Bemisia tabaci]